MDNGAFFFVLILGPLLPVIFVIVVAATFALGLALRTLIGVGVTSALTFARNRGSYRSRRERAYVRKHQATLDREFPHSRA